VLVSKQQQAWARLILYTWIGGGGVTVLGFMLWRIGPSRLYGLIQLEMVQGFLIVLTAFGLGMLLAATSIRTRLFRGRWRYVVICWVLLVAVSLATSAVLTGSTEAVSFALAMIIGLVVALLLLCGIAAVTATALWYGCLRASSTGLRVMAGGLRRLQ